jgi:plastocyanin
MLNIKQSLKISIIALFPVFLYSCDNRGTNRTTDERTTETDRTDRDNGLFNDDERRTIVITATDFAYSPTEITARPDEKLEIQLVNQGQADHNIEFELGENIVGGTKDRSLMMDVKPGETGTLNFTAPEQEGSYNFYCPEHRGRGMTGTLVVRR